MVWLSAVVLLVPCPVLGPTSAAAQVIQSYESLDRSAGEDYYATMEFSVDGAIGNSDYIDSDFSGAFGHRGDSHWVRFYPAYRLKRFKGRERHPRSVSSYPPLLPHL